MKTKVLEVQEKAIEYKITGERREFDRVKITNSRQAYNYALNFWRGDIGVYESTFVLLVDRGNNSLGYAKISQGGISGTVVDIRIILKYAIENLATGIFLFHNHPSGNLRPSPQDTNITLFTKKGFRVNCPGILFCVVYFLWVTRKESSKETQRADGTFLNICFTTYKITCLLFGFISFMIYICRT